MAADITAAADAAEARDINSLERETIRRVAWRLLPALALGYFCAGLDRSNISMAAITMSPDLGFL